MNDFTKQKIKTLLLSAVATLLHSNAQAEELNSNILNQDSNDDELDMRVSRWSRVYNNVAKINQNGDVKYIASHRSHMSHRSGGSGRGGGHYSHVSHYSSYGGGSSHYSSSHYSSSSSYHTQKVKPHKKTPGEYSYGDRTLKSGIYGSDVTSLTGYLATALYLKRTNIKEKSGYSLYDSSVTSAIKHFQKDAGLPQTGIADSKTLNKLSTWDSSNTTVTLGTRELSYSESSMDKGTDVTELVNLLTKAGFPPNPDKIIMINGKTDFTKDIETAVKFFQAYNGIKVSGVVDDKTLSVLKAKAK